MTSPTTPVCRSCGSKDITVGAEAEWNDEKQEWQIVTTYDDYTCADCGEHAKYCGWEENTCLAQKTSAS